MIVDSTSELNDILVEYHLLSASLGWAHKCPL